MGHIFALAGPSGVGKTTFLNRVLAEHIGEFQLLVRSTARPRRPGEIEGTDYNFYTRDGFLQKLFANDFVHVEQHGSDLFGIETKPVEEAIRSDRDAILLAGIFGATRLKAIFRGNISIMFMHTGDRRSLLNPERLSHESPEMRELRRRLEQKITDGIVTLSAEETADAWVDRRMDLNAIGYAYVNGRVRSGDDVLILENRRDRLEEAIEQFKRFAVSQTSRPVIPYLRTNVCFVLMPFTDELVPIYSDHIAAVARGLGLDVLRADGIFSNRPVMDDIRDAVRNARIIISDLTSRNPNVFYETGICHALGKEVVLITQDVDVPFDLRHIRHIRYEYTPRGMARFEETLRETLKNILAS